MGEYTKTSENISRTLDSNPKASKQGSISEILQAYKNGTLQCMSVDEEELLQAKTRDKSSERETLHRYTEYAHRDRSGYNALIQGVFGTPQRKGIEDDELLQGKFDSSSSSSSSAASESLVQREVKPNKTGLPDNLKSGIENLSGYSMDDVRVHYNSDKPAQLQALAYAQGTDIHVAPGQEKHLPHEAWHVVQQMQERVQSTTLLQGVNVNDNEGLEREADVMGGSYTTIQKKKKKNTLKHFTRVTQLAGHGNVVVLNNNWVAKLTTEREANAYTFLRQANNNQNLNAINNIQQLIPGVLQILPNEGVLNLAARAALNVPNPAWLIRWQANMNANQRIIIMENNITGAVDGGYEPAAPAVARPPQTFDIKIGYTTVSEEELTQRGHHNPTRKKNKLRIADIFTGSKRNGYRFCDGNQDELRNRLPVAPHRANCINHISGRLQAIRDYVNNNSTTFVAASVLITIRDDGAIVKLIDLDHPMIDNNRIHQPDDVLLAANLTALQFNNAKFLKYRVNFVRGMDSLIQMIQNL